MAGRVEDIASTRWQQPGQAMWYYSDASTKYIHNTYLPESPSGKHQ